MLQQLETLIEPKSIGASVFLKIKIEDFYLQKYARTLKKPLRPPFERSEKQGVRNAPFIYKKK
jgi:hypothetical protein